MIPFETLLPGIIAVVAGLALGAMLAWYLGRQIAAGEEKIALQAQIDDLIAALRTIGPVAAQEKQWGDRIRVERECAALLRASTQSDARAQQLAARRNPALVGMLAGIFGALLTAVLLYAAAPALQPEPPQEAPAAPGEEPQDNGEIAALEEKLRQSPDDLETRLDLARMRLMRDDQQAVTELTEFVLKRRPHDPRALTYQALVRFSAGESDRAFKMLDQAIARDPHLMDAWIHQIYFRMQLGQLDAAARAVDEASRKNPDHAEHLKQIFTQMKAEAAGAHAGDPANPHGPAASAPPATETASATASAAGLRGTITLAAPRVWPEKACIYVILRPSGPTPGAPLAVRRLPAGPFPLAFEIGGGDSMMGGGLPKQVRLEARLDSDGSVDTKETDTPRAVIESVELGATDVQLVLK
ncbi:MAG: hypothetical protein MUF51_01975 [Vicinamibacteria bacterium]|nr:hypothetical protein [Vicinamibacteria bacterium]